MFIFFKGLVERLKSEQALAMVMAHEIAHIVNRDPITALGRGTFNSNCFISDFRITQQCINTAIHWRR